MDTAGALAIFLKVGVFGFGKANPVPRHGCHTPVCYAIAQECSVITDVRRGIRSCGLFDLRQDR